MGMTVDIPARVAAFLEPRVGLDEPLWVGLSGGRDSVVLVQALVELGWTPRVQALHVHHGLSPRADEWAGFCLELGGRLGLRVAVRRVEVVADGAGIEAAARECRYRAFSDHGIGVLLLAHHRDDQAETLLFNLLRGTGIAGAAGIPAERRIGTLRVLRPLLEVGRDAIDAYAAARKLTWIEDESNEDTAFSRNFLRAEVMPVLEGRFPGAGERLAAAAARFAEADGLLADLAAADWECHAVGEGVSVAALRKLPAPRLANLLRWRLRALGWQPPVASRLEEFVRQLLTAGPGRRPELCLPDGAMRVRRGILRWSAAGSG